MRSAQQIDLIFDGGCGFCTGAVLWLQRRDRRGVIAAHPFQGRGVLDCFGLSIDQAKQSVWVIRHGRRYSGAVAVAVALDSAFDRTVFERAVRIPGVHGITEWAYRWVARHRRWFPGTQPWCERARQECGRE